MALADFRFAVRAMRERTWLQNAGPRAEAHGAAHFVHAEKFAQFINDAVGSAGIELGAVGVLQSGDVARVLDGGTLHTETNSEKRHLAFARVLNCVDHSLNPALAESAGNQNSVNVCQTSGRSFRRIQFLRFDPFNYRAEIMRKTAVHQRFT